MLSRALACVLAAGLAAVLLLVGGQQAALVGGGPDHLQKSTLIYRDLHYLSDDRRAEIVKVRDRIEAFVWKLLADGITERTVCRLIDPRLASIEMFSTANGIYHWYQPDGPHATGEVAESVADFIISAVSCDGTADGRCPRHRRTATQP